MLCVPPHERAHRGAELQRAPGGCGRRVVDARRAARAAQRAQQPVLAAERGGALRAALGALPGLPQPRIQAAHILLTALCLQAMVATL
jgi:broad specificity phosphatase PhoE